MLSSEAKQTLRRIAKAMRPATPPWNTDETVLDEWTAAILARNLENADIHQLLTNGQQTATHVGHRYTNLEN